MRSLRIFVSYAEKFRLDTAPVEGALGGAAAKGHRGAAESGGKRGEKASKLDAVHILDSDATAARELLPPARGCTLVKDTLWHDRWVVHYPSPVPPYSTSKSWGPRTGMTCESALTSLLAWAWAQHAKATGEVSPWCFD